VWLEGATRPVAECYVTGSAATNQMRAWSLALLEPTRIWIGSASSRERGQSWSRNGSVLHRMGDGMGKRDWVKSVGKKLRDDMGDCPTLPQEMLDLLASLRTEKGDGVWGGATSNLNERGSIPRGVWRG